jgi:putative endonuclease
MSTESELKIIRREPRKTTNHQSGIDAEGMATAYLKQNGYKILATRFKCKNGEIDIIASKRKLIVFIEVKSRKSALLDDPIGSKGRRRIANAALQYIYENPEIAEYEMRFDFIFVDSANPLHHNTIQHTEAAWIMEE